MTSAAGTGGTGGIDLPKAIQDYIGGLTQEQRDALKLVREKLTEMHATDAMKAQVV